MELSDTTVDGVPVITVSGRLDSQKSADFKKGLAQFLSSNPKKLVLDMGGVSYISSAGLRELFLAARELQRGGGKLVVCNPQPDVKHVFDIAGFAICYQIVGSREEALASKE